VSVLGASHSASVVEAPTGDGPTGGTPVGDEPLSDDELTALALAADPDQPLGDDAVPIDLFLSGTAGSLPEWYMAPPRARLRSRMARSVILALVAAFLLIEAFGLCSTYGQAPFH
jgi:hypothetical protein